MKKNVFLILAVFTAITACRKPEPLEPETPVIPVPTYPVENDTLAWQLDMSNKSFCLYQYKALKLCAPLSIFPGAKYLYTWLPGGDTTAAKIFDRAGTYKLCVDKGMPWKDTILITISECRTTRHIRVTKDTSVCLYPYTALVLDATVPDNQLHSYVWDPFIFLPCIEITAPGSYKAKVTTGLFTKAITVQVHNLCAPLPLYVPNSFTPNGDGINDTWAPQSNSTLAYVYFDVRNADGLKVFSSTDLKNAWDGSYNNAACPASVYTYSIEYSFPGGQKQTLSGEIELIR